MNSTGEKRSLLQFRSESVSACSTQHAILELSEVVSQSGFKLAFHFWSVEYYVLAWSFDI